MKQERGHFCWCCSRSRPNERFSAAGHARHICKDCTKLGAEEVAYRQAVQNIERLRDCTTGRVKRKQRAGFARFLQDPNERIRRYAEAVAARDSKPLGGADDDDAADDDWRLRSERRS